MRVQRRSHLLLQLAAASALCACGPALPTTAAPPGAATPTQAGEGELEHLQWLSGTWVLAGPEGMSEEHWSAPLGGTLVGMNRTVRQGRTIHFEHLRIEQRSDGVFYVATPVGQPTAEFRLVRQDVDLAVFENPNHDYPKRITYRRVGEALHARIEGAPSERVAEWSWTLASGSAPSGTTTNTPTEREKLALLPISDSELFRQERQTLRQLVRERLLATAPQYEVLPLEQVDAAIAPTSKSGGACAYRDSPQSRRAGHAGWQWTTLTHVHGTKGASSELWLGVNDYAGRQSTFTAPWPSTGDRLSRYQSAVKQFAPGSGEHSVLGALSGEGATTPGQQQHGTLSICERQSLFQCHPGTAEWLDVAPALAKCFSGVDQTRQTVLLEGARCELNSVDGPSDPRAALESCVCAAMKKSVAAARPGRRRVVLAHEAADLAGVSRPNLRVVDVTGNMHAQADYRYFSRTVKEKTERRSSRRLSVENLDTLAAPLARCKVVGITTALLHLNPNGTVSSARVTSGPTQPAACVERVLRAGEFTCTDDGKPAVLTLAIIPENP